MKANIESLEDILPPNFESLTLKNFKEFSKAKEGYLNQQEFQSFVNNFFQDDKKLSQDLLSPEFFLAGNKSGSVDGINFNDFKEVFQDCYLLKSQDSLENDNDGLDIKFETNDNN